MRNNPIVFLILLLLVCGSSCSKDKCKETHSRVVRTAVYMPYDEARSSVAVEPPRAIQQTGKLYFIDDYVLVNEYLQGIHVIDNADPSNPITLSFVNIPGNVDIAVRGNSLYADSGTDLLTFDFTDPSNPTLQERQENVLPYPVLEGHWFDETQGVVTEVIEEVVTEEYEFDCDSHAMPNTLDDVAFFENSAAGGGGESGGGSMARFALAQNHLYVVTNSTLIPFDVASGLPQKREEQNIGWGLETIFPFGDKLFIGSVDGMMIYDVSDGAYPFALGSFSHVTSCDPVVANEDYAFVTLRAEATCQGVNRLDLLDIQDLNNPEHLLSCDMTNPKGLGLDENTLFVCDEGIKVYDITNPMELCDNITGNFGDSSSFDLIPRDGLLMVVADDGFYQYDYSDLENIELLSVISASAQ